MTTGYWLLADQSKGRGKMKKILIVGGGMAGSIVANGLARKLSKEMNNDLVEITVISATDQHLYQPGLLYLAFGRVRENELYRDQREILEKRIKFHVDPAVNIDADNKKVTTESGKVYEGKFRYGTIKIKIDKKTRDIVKIKPKTGFETYSEVKGTGNTSNAWFEAAKNSSGTYEMTTKGKTEMAAAAASGGSDSSSSGSSASGC